MPQGNDLSTEATCTSCTFSEDFSNYWTANMWYQHRNGSFKRVQQFANEYLEPAKGGLTVYYIPPYDGKTKVTAFKPGFRMTVGNPMIRTASRQARQICMRCFGANFEPFGGAPCTGDDTSDFPKTQCAGGIRSNIFFPTCWDGVNLDSADHQSHVAYPTSGTFESGGPCPSTHPVKIPQVMYEVMWNTTEFNTAEYWPTDGTQPFVFSYGDPTGYGQHADYMFGWKDDSLQRAMDAECNVACPTLQSQSADQANQCIKQAVVDDPTDGWVDALPGSNPVTTTNLAKMKGWPEIE
ncbi:MAG: hypothetical protein M1820_000859 [Bogoriella megaspora]|nr:MAG: hypothetical protein M1820_000859 [Bogoriella megaspora]